MLPVMSEDSATDVAVAATEEVVIELDRRTTTAKYRKGDTLLQTARSQACRRRIRVKPVPAERVWHGSPRAAPGW